MAEHQPTVDYQALAAFRYQVRRFLRFSEEAARAVGIEPQQHQMLLAIKGLPDDTVASVGEIANRLQIQHHSAVELVDRLEQQGLVQRKRSTEDRRQVLLTLTARGERVLRELSLHHQRELQALGPELLGSLKKLLGANSRADSTERRKPNAASALNRGSEKRRGRS